MSQPARPGTLTSNNSDHNIRRNKPESRNIALKTPGSGSLVTTGSVIKRYLLLRAFRKMSLLFILLFLSLFFFSRFARCSSLCLTLVVRCTPRDVNVAVETDDETTLRKDVTDDYVSRKRLQLHYKSNLAYFHVPILKIDIPLE